MKKVWICLLCLLLTVGAVLTVSAENENLITVTADKTTFCRGDTVSLTLSVSCTDPITSLGWIIPKDNAFFVFVEGQFAAGLPSTLLSTIDANGIVLAFASPTTLSGEIATVTLRIKEDATFEQFQFTQGVAAKNGASTVEIAVNEEKNTVVCDHKDTQYTKETAQNHGVECVTCGETWQEEHTWDGGVVTTAPDCKTPGVKTYTCTACGEEMPEDLPITDTHSYSSWQELDEITHGRICSVCQKEETGSHDVAEGKCTDCGYLETYTVKFLAEDGTVLDEDLYHYGDEVVEPIAPNKAADHIYTYAFAGWDKEVIPCTGNATYQATYAATYIEYTVIFLDEDGKELSSQVYHYGDGVTAPAAPTKAADNTYTYTFAGWDKEVVPCAGDVTYTASYTATYIAYTVIFQYEDGTEISRSTYHYGDAVDVPANPEKASTVDGEFVFLGWDLEIIACQGNTTYTAQFEFRYFPPDVNDDGKTDDSDAIQLLRHTLFPDIYPIAADGDVNSDGEVNDADAIYLLRYTLFPDIFPMYPNGKKA